MLIIIKAKFFLLKRDFYQCKKLTISDLMNFSGGFPEKKYK